MRDRNAILISILHQQLQDITLMQMATATELF